MICHIVAWNYGDGFSDIQNTANALKVKNELENLKNLIDEIVEIKVIINPLKTSNCDVSLLSFFKSEETLASYQIHPEHKRVSAFVGKVMKGRRCIDFIV